MRRSSLPATLRRRLPVRHPLRKLLAVTCIAAAGGLLALALQALPGTSWGMSHLSDLLYDATYRLRPSEDRTGGDVVIIALDESSLEALKRQGTWWPVRRDWWAYTVELMERCGARVVAFDVLFEEPSLYQNYEDDDQEFARVLDAAKVPVVMAVMAAPPGAAPPAAAASDPAAFPGAFDVPVKRTPVFGAVNIVQGTRIRSYEPAVNGLPSLGARAAAIAGAPPRDWARSSFRLHFYGPHAGPDGRPVTYRYVPVERVFAAARKVHRGAPLESCGIDPALFRDKVVFVGYTAAGTYDVKSTPVSDLVPGVELHATAVDNLLHDRHVLPASGPVSAAATFGVALMAAVGVFLPRRAGFKLLGGAAALGVLLVAAWFAFGGPRIHWLPLAAPLAAWMVATAAAFEWTYVVEGRHRRQIVKAFSQMLSPELVAQIERDPRQLDPGGERRDMTVLFTDLADFTTLTERLDNHVLVDLLNYYFDQMAPLVMAGKGTLDKYIGDSIMSFWNAPVPQPDHAALACRAALAMAERERLIQPELARRGAAVVLTRIGINTGPMVVGFTGSGQRLNYTVLGDAVNLGSRLEGANKFYASQILLSQNTADAVRDRFVVRQLDVLRVKGKQQPMAVYELLAEGRPDEALRRRVEGYERALAAYRRQHWNEAESHLEALLKEFPTDGPADRLLARIFDLRREPPGPDWDGVYVAKGK